MPTDNDNETGRAQEDAKGDLLRGMGLLALPVLAFQRNMLGIARAGINEASLLKPVQTLAESELHALMMILDPNGACEKLAGRRYRKEAEGHVRRSRPEGDFWLDQPDRRPAGDADVAHRGAGHGKDQQRQSQEIERTVGPDAEFRSGQFAS